LHFDVAYLAFNVSIVLGLSRQILLRALSLLLRLRLVGAEPSTRVLLLRRVTLVLRRLTGKAWQLLLRLRGGRVLTGETRLIDLARSGGRPTGTSKTDLLVLRRTWFDVELGLASVDSVTFVAHTFIADVCLFLLLSRVADSQVSIDKRGSELVLGYGGSQQFGDSAGKELLLEDFAHTRPSVGILYQHIGEQILQVLRVVGRNLWITAS